MLNYYSNNHSQIIYSPTINTMKNTIMRLVLWAIALPITTFAQHQHDHRQCGSTHYNEYLQEIHPEMKAQRILAAQQKKGKHTADNAINGVLTVPVVVHIVYNNATENISDEQVYAQMETLNEDFRKLNVDVANTPNAFASAVGDVQIQFCLASVDPDGNATSGIVRTATSHGVFVYPTNDMMHAGTGGSDAWNTDYYLNVYVVALDGGILGYAPYPGNASASEDAVVVRYTAFGYDGTAAAPFDLGRTLTHEVGHWLGLVHIWGDADCGDDQVADTPVAKDANGGCPTFPLISDCGNSPNGEMFMNYMDYTDDACMFMFTNGQKDRMRGYFNPGGLRADLLVSRGCGGTCPRTFFLTDDFSGVNADFQARDLIIGWNKVNSGADIVYRAGDHVRLKPGFHAVSCTFNARIDGCSGAKNGEARGNQVVTIPATTEFKIVPNPFNESFTVQVNSAEPSVVSIRILDMQGRLVYAQQENTLLDAGQNAIQIEATDFMPGIYFVEMRTNTTQKVIKVAKMR